MYAYAILILLVILILANFGLHIFNTIVPPCEQVEEYFKSARMLPDGASASLGSIPTGSENHYIGARLVDIPGTDTPGLASRNEQVNMEPIPHQHKEILNALNTIIPKEGMSTDKSEYRGSMAEFDDNLIAQMNNNTKRVTTRKMINRNTSLDGYS